MQSSIKNNNSTIYKTPITKSMKIKTFAVYVLASAAMVSCTDKKDGAGDYNLTVNFEDPSADGTMAFLSSFDSGDKIDSVTIADSKAIFTGSVEEPTIVVVSYNGNRGYRFILESGNTEVRNGRAISNLNDRFRAFTDDYRARYDSIRNLIEQTKDEAEHTAMVNAGRLHLDSVMSETMIANIYNPIGYMIMLDKASGMEVEEFSEFLKQYPHLTKFKRIDSIKKHFDAVEATSAGKTYTDFEINQNGETVKLSDYVKPGQYTLVDFWASWCGPCKKEIAIIRQLYEKYNAKGLEVVGVDVWETPEQAQEYLNENPLPWNIMLTGEGSEITDKYGINGIPCIILIDPEGKIVARDLFEEELVNTVSEAMGDHTVTTEK